MVEVIVPVPYTDEGVEESGRVWEWLIDNVAPSQYKVDILPSGSANVATRKYRFDFEDPAIAALFKMMWTTKP